MAKILAIVLSLLYLTSCTQNSEAPNTPQEVKALMPNQGVWVSVFSKEEVLYSKAKAKKLIEFCRKSHLNEIYLQVYRAGEAFYDSPTIKKPEYLTMTETMQQDPLDFILEEAKHNGIKVYAWVNVLSLAQNKNAPILKKFGQSVLTRDKNLRSSIKTEDVNDSDKFYLRDDQLFLEPGDEKVVEYTLGVIDEILTRYPTFDGLHLDYIRYPYTVPFIPDSRFIDNGVSYGFGERNLARFEKAYELSPRRTDMFKDAFYLKWDNWKRDQVTNLVQKIAGLVRQKAPQWKISCAVVPSLERAYSVAYQDWAWWLEQKTVDYVVLMNYTRDTRLFYETTKTALASFDQNKIYVGVGSFLYKDKDEFVSNYDTLKKLHPQGIVFFSYDDMIARDPLVQTS